MGDLNNIRETVASYDAIVDRAIDITAEAPYWAHCFKREGATVSIDGDTAILSWPDTTYEYGESYLCREHKEFDANLLLLNDADLAQWKRDQMVAYEQEQEARNEQRAREAEAQERAAYEQLKYKFG